ncbi:MAG TPA: diguanylate cyclase [Candidatus Binatia bacterium]|nr:diguanylate cyclase [Candidatus Binatia bacterium]
MDASAPAVPPSPLRLLAVEDSTMDARLLRESLRDSIARDELKLQIVPTLAQAEEAVRTTAFDCVLLDLGLPDGNGVDNVQRIRSANRRQAVVVMTGLNSEEAAIGTLQRGAQDYVVKDHYDGPSILRRVRHAIERNRVLSEVDRMREEQYFLATHDALTRLPNRQLFDDRARRLVAQADRGNSCFAVGYMDLDGFKQVNDRHGHAVGDAVLRAVAQVMQGCLRETDTAARIGGDEFLLLLTPVHSPQEAEAVVARVRSRIVALNRIEGREVQIGASVGLAFFPQDARTLDLLVISADQAMYAAKRAARAAMEARGASAAPAAGARTA